MQSWQQGIIILSGFISFAVFLKGYYEIVRKKNAFGLANYLSFLGIFVWGDSIILGPFWTLVCMITLLLNDWYLFLLSISLFWSVRSWGEVTYWLNEQFADKHRNPPQTLKFSKLFQSDAIWFVYQLFWQVILVVSLITSLYLANVWLQAK